MSRRFSSLVPLAQPHPRKPSGLRQSIDSTPFAQPHPRNLDSPQRTRLPHPPRRIALCRISRPRPLFGLIPFAQLHPRKKTSGRGFIPSVNSRQTSSPPLAPIHPRKLSRLRQSLGLTPLAQLHLRNLGSPQRTRLPHPPRRIAVSSNVETAVKSPTACAAMSRRFSSLVPLAAAPPAQAFSGCVSRSTPHHLRSLTRATSMGFIRSRTRPVPYLDRATLGSRQRTRSPR